MVRSTAQLSADAAALSELYRSTGTSRLGSPALASAYAAARMPATFAAIGRALAATADRTPGFAPTSLLDVGAGTGAAAWAAASVWPGLEDLTLVDREPAAVALGRRLAGSTSAPPTLARASWVASDLVDLTLPEADLVIAAYVLGELEDTQRAAVVERLWTATAGVLLLVEPGSRAGFGRIREARQTVIDDGGHAVAPCPGDLPCPIDPTGSTWCHFLARLDRSPLQRTTKRAARSWEDEPFSYVAISRRPGDPQPRVVLGRPRHHPGRVELRICDDGRIETRAVSRRDGERWRVARDLAWGDPLVSSG